MKMLFRVSAVIAIITSVVTMLNSCGPSTIITGTWDREDTSEQYDDVLVSALINNVNMKANLEEAMVRAMSEKGIKASESIDFIPTKFIEDNDQKSKIIDMIRKNGNDAIISLVIVEKDTETRYIPERGRYAPYHHFHYYRTFWDYYDHWRYHFDRDDYYTEQDVYYIETNVYDADSEELVWSAQSKTYEMSHFEDFAEDFANKIVEKLDSENII